MRNVIVSEAAELLVGETALLPLGYGGKNPLCPLIRIIKGHE